MKRINSTKRINPGSVLRVYKKGFGYSKLKVIDVNDYYLSALSDDEFINHINVEDRVETYLWVEDIASYDFTLTVIGRITSDFKIIIFKHTEEITGSNERKCLRADVNLPMKFFVFSPSGKNKSFSTESVNFLYGTITELDDRSAKLECSEKIDGNVFFKGHIALDGSDVELIGKITLLVRDDNSIYKLEFEGIHDKERNRILDYIFNIYRE